MFPKSNKISLFLISFLAVVGLFAFNPSFTKAASGMPVVAVSDPGFAAQYISQTISDPIKIEVGSTVTVDVKFKNVGTKNWEANNRNFLSAFTMEPRYHISVFATSNWIDKIETAKMSPSVVKPGEYGTLTVQLKAPEKVGTYTEKFWLASQNHSWVKGGYFYFIINVVAKSTVTPTTPAVTAPVTVTPSSNTSDTSTTVSAYKAKKFFSNVKDIKASGASQVKVILGLQNLGTATWQKYSFVANSPLSLANSADLSFADSSWQNSNTIFEKPQAVAQWSTTRDEFNIVTPAKKGSYTLTLKVKADNQEINDLEINIPVEVTSDASSYVPPFFNNSNNNVNTIVEEIPRLSEEPKIRVGVWQNPTDQVQFQSADDDYVVYSGDVLQGVLAKNTLATLYYENGIYNFASTNLNFSSSDYIRLAPSSNMHAVFTLLNYNRAVSWKGPVNFNKYRGVMELRKINSGTDVYVIEEVLMEDYVAGIAETSNAGPIEYIKALLTAARTYAYYVANYTSKHDARNFDVVAHTGDQLYLGYASEVLMPNVVAAQRATRGYMATYDNNYIITPYYSTSDGRTRSWAEVWGGSNRPWLVSVPAIYDKRDGKAMAGHGVGMSARDAAYMADEGGKNWQEILKYYYTGVNVNLIYQ
ncbi:MAG: SpoIID/LytB domain-containing protein [Patescibacteria group bacterium]|nr:SpoIID/LytB domain-containing protein [Patescibacteria group bacterium]